MRHARYFIAQHQDILDLQASDKDGAAGEYQFYHPDWTPGDPAAPTAGPWLKPESVVFVIMRDSRAIPHPRWRELPHILNQKPIKTVLAPPAGQAEKRTALLAAWAQSAVPISDTDTTFNLAEYIHKQKMKGFL